MKQNPKDQFHEIASQSIAHSHIDEYLFEELAEKCESIADSMAIAYAAWLLDQDGRFETDEELLERFKKEYYGE